MMSIEKIETFVRGGPEMPDEMLPGESAGQFDSLLNALAILPAAEHAEGRAPVLSDGSWAGFAEGSGPHGQPWRVNPNDLSGPVPGSASNTDQSTETPPIISETPEPTPGKIPDLPLPDNPEPTVGTKPPFGTGSAGTSKLNYLRGERMRTPSLERLPNHEVPIKEVKTEKPVVHTPPIVDIPINPPQVASARSQQQVQGLSIQELVTAKNPQINDGTVAVTDSIKSSDASRIAAVAGDASTGEAQMDLGTGQPRKTLAEELRVDPGKIADAIFDRFASNADKAIRASDLKIPVDAEPVIEQIEKPILEISPADLEDGEPVLLKFRLKPAELGSIEIRLEKNAAGKLNIEFLAESEIATKVLRESFEQLRDSLKDAGWQIEELNILNRQSSDQTLDQQRDAKGDEDHQSATHSRSDAGDSAADLDMSDEQSDESASRLVSIRA